MGKNRKRQSKNKFEQADRLFSTLVRLKHVTDQGYVQCYTCDKFVHFNNIQCGHFIPRGEKMTRFLEENCRPQCHHCNVVLSGNLTEFEDRLNIDYPGLPDRLRDIARQVNKMTSSDLDELVKTLKKQIEQCGGKESVSKY